MNFVFHIPHEWTGIRHNSIWTYRSRYVHVFSWSVIVCHRLQTQYSMVSKTSETRPLFHLSRTLFCVSSAAIEYINH